MEYDATKFGMYVFTNVSGEIAASTSTFLKRWVTGCSETLILICQRTGHLNSDGRSSYPSRWESIILEYKLLSEGNIYFTHSKALWVTKTTQFRRPLSADARIRSRVSPCGICGGQSGTGTGFSPSTSIFPCQFHSTGAPLDGRTKKNYLIIFITGLHNKPQGCGASVASAAGPFTRNKTTQFTLCDD
jgi:hypothetical protein